MEINSMSTKFLARLNFQPGQYSSLHRQWRLIRLWILEEGSGFTIKTFEIWNSQKVKTNFSLGPLPCKQNFIIPRNPTPEKKSGFAYSLFHHIIGETKFESFESGNYSQLLNVVRYFYKYMYSVIIVALALAHYGRFSVFTCGDNGPEQRLL